MGQMFWMRSRRRRPHPFQTIDNIIVTPHVGSRTFESVERQALRAVTNIVEYLKGGTDYIQVNTFCDGLPIGN